MLIVISGPSGAGKNTVINHLISRRGNLKLMCTATTRAKRPGEKEGLPYYFFSEEEFLKRKEKGEFFETQEVHGTFRGIMKKDLDEVIKNTELDFIKDIDVFGNMRLRNYLKDKVLSIFLEVPDEELFRRLVERGESEESARFRISRGALEREHMSEYDAVIENINLEETVGKILTLIEKAKK